MRRSAPAGELHAREAEWHGRQVWLLASTSPAIVLGSHQPVSHFDPLSLARAGLTVTRRRSGGAAVLVGSGEVLWVDFLLPAGDALWDDDVRRSGWWVGEVWAEAVESCGLGRPEVWREGLRPGPRSDAVCFAGLGPGEVTVDGRKVVGVSQRRTRAGALFQTAAMLRWEPAAYLSLLADPGPSAPPGLPGLAGLAAGLGAESGPRLEAALLRLLMT